VKDAKYRGKSANRRDLFNAETKFGDSTSDKLEDEQDTDDGSDIEERGESVDEDISGVSEMSNDSSHESNDSSSISADENDRDLDDEDQQTRRDKVRRLLAQETKYIIFTLPLESNFEDLWQSKCRNPLRRMRTRERT